VIPFLEEKALERLVILRFLQTKDPFLDMEKVDRDYFLTTGSNFPEKFPVY
jgi:hypothetical protein